VLGIKLDFEQKQLFSHLLNDSSNYSVLKLELNSKIYLDHASWNRAGYRSAFPFEGEFKDAFMTGKT
jgi:hypothetical protein